MQKIYIFNPYLKSTIWGGRKIIDIKRDLDRRLGLTDDARLGSFENIGESWELSAVPGCESTVAEGQEKGETLSRLVEKYGADLVGRNVYSRFGNKFPLLIKFIDAAADLSLQVHPDDALAMKRHNSLGKTEMWYIMDTNPGALIHSGLNRDFSPEEYDRSVADGSLMKVVNSFESAPGETYFLPAGRLHAIGAGNLLIEIQESSDITYRVDDYGRRDANGNLRELHTAQAREAIDYSRTTDACKAPVAESNEPDSMQTVELEHCPYFDVDRVVVHGVHTMHNSDGSFLSLICIKGSGKVSVDDCLAEMYEGRTVLIPATCPDVRLEGDMTLIAVTVPEV